MKKIAVFLATIMVFIGISGAKATEMTIAKTSETPIANLIIGKWSFVGETEKGILVKAITVFEPKGQVEFSMTAYVFGLPVSNRKIFSQYSVGDVNGKSYLFLHPNEGGWMTAEIVSFESGKMRLMEISDSGNIPGVSYPVLWEKIAEPTE